MYVCGGGGGCRPTFQILLLSSKMTKSQGNHLEPQFAGASFITDHIRRMGKVIISVCSQGGQGVGTPSRSGWGEGYPSVPTPWPRYLPPVQVKTGRGQGVPQGTYPMAKVPTPLSRSGWGGGYPKVTSPLAKVPTLGPRYLPLPRIGQHMEYLKRRGRYDSCVHAGGLFVLI